MAISFTTDQLSESHTLASSSGSLTLPADYKYSSSLRSQPPQQGRWMNTLNSKSGTSKRSSAGSKYNNDLNFVLRFCLKVCHQC